MWHGARFVKAILELSFLSNLYFVRVVRPWPIATTGSYLPMGGKYASLPGADAHSWYLKSISSMLVISAQHCDSEWFCTTALGLLRLYLATNTLFFSHVDFRVGKRGPYCKSIVQTELLSRFVKFTPIVHLWPPIRLHIGDNTTWLYM